MAETKWGRKETIFWPPKQPIYTYGAIFLALIATGFFVYLRFAYGMTPLQQYYLPLYLKTEITGSIHKAGKYQLLFVSDGKRRSFLVTEQDVEAGNTPQRAGRPLPLKVSTAATKAGFAYLYRGPLTVYQNKPLHAYLKHAIYDDVGLFTRFSLPLSFGLAALVLQLPFSIPRDIRRRKELKYGRRLKGPVMVTPREFNRAVHGTGIGIKTDDCKEMLRIPQAAEDQHIEIIGDTGTGKTTIIMQLLRQIQARGHSAIIYDPACEFIQRFYDENRGDIVLNPLDKRCPYWGPSEELVRWAEAKTIAASLFQPTTDRKGEFFIESPQKIFAHLLLDQPSPQELVAWMSKPDEIDHRVKGTELAALIDPRAPQQRSGVLGSLGLVADSFRLLPKKSETEARWTAREWSEERKGWIFITSQPAEREALRPLHSLWIDMLVLRLLTAPKENQRPAWFVLDELASLQKLPQLHTAITENRKSKNPIVLGFQGKAQLEVIYGHLAEVMLSQPATKIFLKTTEPNAAEWVSKAIGKVEIERMRETHFDGSRDGRNFSIDRQVEPLVLDSEISGLENLRAFLKYGNHVARFSFPYIDVPASQPKFVERLVNDYIHRKPKQEASEGERPPVIQPPLPLGKVDAPLPTEPEKVEQSVGRQGELWHSPQI
ncbi:MAG: ArsR family transcriptional regulator [Acidobacteriales bacterium 59-55]|jgi:type IV secretory pathway TraG/TraD family ATPase VirD4|uniref:Type IV secretory pathway TraG/TraD family ATPase VirD4 n=1 Tax=Acidipila rosea TaxID=768535 RepID=A0A4R1KYV4_9BACT|nr:MAG: ArsR family transcriptional regulator [Acidobacteriales bacterium 59-55]TCK70706.1 type IV secretory pathway TraG/TraD family ATPase VirD4 [Acidipila rosea]